MQLHCIIKLSDNHPGIFSEKCVKILVLPGYRDDIRHLREWESPQKPLQSHLFGPMHIWSLLKMFCLQMLSGADLEPMSDRCLLLTADLLNSIYGILIALA